MKYTTLARITSTMAVVAALAGVANFLALNDIHHCSAELTLEWSLVRYTNFAFLVFLILSTWTIRRSLRVADSNPSAKGPTA